MKRSHDHTRRLAALGLVFTLLISSLPMLAPSASAELARDVIFGQPDGVPIIRSESPLHDDLLAPTYDGLGPRFDITSSGVIYSVDPANEKRLRKSVDRQTWETVQLFDDIIWGVYVSEHAWGEYLWVSTAGGKVYRSIDGVSFSLSLQMLAESYAIGYWSFASDHDAIIIGEYGGKTVPAAVHMSTDAGNTWSRIFNTSSYRPDIGAHIHLVTIDPYNGWFYVGAGDVDAIRGMHVSRDRGATWESFGSAVISGTSLGPLYPTKVGYLGATYPDPDRVLFYTDGTPEVWEYIKSTGEIRMLLRMPDPYLAAEVKTYSAITGAHGVSYFAMTEYNQLDLGRVWMTIDGTSYYLIDDTVSSGNLRIHDGVVYSSKLQFNDLTMEEAAALIADGRRSVDMMYGSARYLYVDSPMQDVTVTVTGAQVSNAIKNPSFEVPATAWGQEFPDTISYSEDHARHGNKSLKFTIPADKTKAYFSQGSINMPLDGSPIVVKFSIMSDGPIGMGTDPRVGITFTEDGENKDKVWFLGTVDTGGINYYHDQWMDYTIYWTDTPSAGELKSVTLTLYDKTVNYYIDSFSVSKYPIFVEDDTPSGNVSFMLGDHLIEAGELAEGESKTISLPSNVWLDGLVPIVPVSGLAYTVSIDGTPVSESEQSIRETNKLLEQTIPLIVGLMVIGGLFTMIGKAFGRLKF